MKTTLMHQSFESNNTIYSHVKCAYKKYFTCTFYAYTFT